VASEPATIKRRKLWPNLSGQKSVVIGPAPRLRNEGRGQSGDSEEVEHTKIKAYLERQGIKQLKSRWFIYGFICALVLVKLFGLSVFGW
jgi:hypothetical protein